MAQYQENFKIAAPNPIDKRYLSPRTSNGAQVPYSATTEVYSIIIPSERYKGLTVLLESGSTNVEYWFKDGISNGELIEKTGSSGHFVGITGATNLGFFSGQTGIQRLDLSGFPTSPLIFNGSYYSEYNWYYVENSIVKLGSPIQGGVLRRAYVDSTRTKSWIYNFDISTWELSDCDVTINVGNNINLYNYSGVGYSQTTWLTGFQTNGSTSINVFGSLTTGLTLTIGNAIYRDIHNNNLKLRTIINDSPEFLSIKSDDDFIRFSGASGIINAQNNGGGVGVFSGKSGTQLEFRTLVPSGDTTITERPDGKIIIYSSSEDGSGNAVTGVTNLGTGVTFSSGITNKNLLLNTLTGSGNTSITKVGDEIIVYSSGGTGGNDKFSSDIVVSIASGKTFGKYLNNDVILASGKTSNEVMLMALNEVLPPTIVLDNLITDISFGQVNKTVTLGLSYIINTTDAIISITTLEYNRGGGWSTLDINTITPYTYIHTIDDSINRFNTTPIQYRYTVIDSEGGSNYTIIIVTPETYLAPSITCTLNGIITIPETQNVREKGNVITNVSGIITSQRSFVNIIAWALERRYNNGAWYQLTSGSGLNNQNVSIPSTLDSSIPTTVSSIDYRITYVDDYINGSGGTEMITFNYYSYWGFNVNSILNESQIKSLNNKDFLNSNQLVWDNINSSVNEYTYYAYSSTYPDVISINKNSGGQDINAWQQILQQTIINDYGESLNYKIMRTNATQAYGGDSIVIN